MSPSLPPPLACGGVFSTFCSLEARDSRKVSMTDRVIHPPLTHKHLNRAALPAHTTIKTLTKSKHVPRPISLSSSSLRRVACRRPLVENSVLQGGLGGWPTGNGKKLSSSQVHLGQATCLDVAYFLSISCGPSTPSALYRVVHLVAEHCFLTSN